MDDKKGSLKQYYSVKEAAEVMNVSTATIRRMVERKELPYIKAGSRVLIPIKHFDKWQKESTVAYAQTY